MSSSLPRLHIVHTLHSHWRWEHRRPMHILMMSSRSDNRALWYRCSCMMKATHGGGRRWTDTWPDWIIGPRHWCCRRWISIGLLHLITREITVRTGHIWKASWVNAALQTIRIESSRLIQIWVIHPDESIHRSHFEFVWLCFHKAANLFALIQFHVEIHPIYKLSTIFDCILLAPELSLIKLLTQKSSFHHWYS